MYAICIPNRYERAIDSGLLFPKANIGFRGTWDLFDDSISSEVMLGLGAWLGRRAVPRRAGH